MAQLVDAMTSLEKVVEEVTLSMVGFEVQESRVATKNVAFVFPFQNLCILYDRRKYSCMYEYDS